MAVGQVSSTNYDNWQLIATNTTTSGATSSFTGLTGYKKYLVLVDGVTFASAAAFVMTFNSSSTNYASAYSAENQSTTARSTYSGSLYLRFNNTTNTSFRGILQIDNILAGPKLITADITTNGTTDETIHGMGFWNDTAAVTQINLTSANGSTAFTAGSISLYGLAA
jgi:hypothetical protein